MASQGPKIVACCTQMGKRGPKMVNPEHPEGPPRAGFPRKNCCSFGFCPHEGGWGMSKLPDYMFFVIVLSAIDQGSMGHSLASCQEGEI